MRFGLHTGQHRVAFDDLRDLWREAAAWGFDACYVFDHVVPLHSDVEAFLPEEAPSADGSCLEGFTTLAALARAVPGVNVGIMVAAVGYRTVGLVAHAVAALARAAPGRIEIGIGGGWFEPDYRVLGLPFPPARERMDALERALDALTEWFGAGAASVPDVADEAPIVRLRSRPRLWVAGIGERRLIPLAARFADSWNAMYLTAEEFAHKVDVLERACADAGRDPATVERSIALRAFCSRSSSDARAAVEALAHARGRDAERVAARSLVGTPEECAEQIIRYADAGATHVAVMAHPPYDRDGLGLLASECFPLARGP